MASIRLQFVLGADVPSRAIAWFTQGHYSHVDAVAADDYLLGARINRVGGQPPGVQFRPPAYARWRRRTVMQIACTSSQRNAYWDFLRGQIGKPYDRAAIWGFVFDRDWREPDSWICSELQAAAAEHSLILPKLFVPCARIAPVPLAVILSAVGGAVIEDEINTDARAEA